MLHTHESYTINGWTSSTGQRIGWKLRLIHGCTEIADWSINPRAYHCPLGILLPKMDRNGFRGDNEARTLPTLHGSLDYYSVFAPNDPDDPDDYLIVLIDGRGMYYGVSEFVWTVAGWREVGSIFLQYDHECEEILGPNWHELTDATIARRLLEAYHETL